MNNFSEKVSFIWSVADLLRGPTREVQDAIVARLDAATTRLPTVAAIIHGAIDRLRECRFAPISEAVTGKTNVRGA